MLNGQTSTQSLYQRADAATIGLLDELIAERAPVFVIPSWFVAPEAAQVGFLLSERLRDLTGTPERTYRSFFANSRHEAVHGAIKLMRHAGLATFDRHQGRVLVLDSDPLLAACFDPRADGPERALVPHVHVVPTVAEFQAALAGGYWCGGLVRGPHDLTVAALTAIGRTGHARGVPIAVDLSDSALDKRDSGPLAALRPDLVIVGEELSGRTVPFAAFVGTESMFRQWATPTAAFVHSTTYGGNTLAMRRVKARLLDDVPPGSDAARQVVAAHTDWQLTLRLYERHVNPVTARMHRRLRGALHVVRAEGTRLTVELDSGRRIEVTDGVCGGGLGVSGHSPHDARTDVLATHRDDIDYVGQLETVLARETGLSRAFPGVSGAGAVETAVTLAMLATGGRRRIVVFDHNYGGKTLVSLLATAAASSRAPFAPLYDDVIYLDPFAPDAVTAFEREAAAGDVALVWLELVHGSSDSYAPLPDVLLASVARARERHGFLVGIDEILTSFYRCGRRFAFHGRLPEVDLVTVSKALSYMCFPVASTIVAESVYERASSADRRLTEHLRTRFANQLGAHIALHSLSRVDELGLADRTAALARQVRACLDALPVRPRSVLRRHFSEGLFLRLGVRPPRLPWVTDGAAAETSVLSLLFWWVSRRRVLVSYDCLGVPLTATGTDIARITAGIRALARKTPVGLWWSARIGMAWDDVLTRVRHRTTKGNP